MSDQSKWVRIEREFDAPIEMVWRMWTDPDLFKQWYGPKGMSVPTAEMDLTVGGTRKICMVMQRPDSSMSMWFTGVYKEVSAPHRLVYTESMCDEAGTILSPQSMGMPDDFPDITEVSVELSEAGGKTKMVMVHVGVAEGTAGAGGWNQAFDKLADCIRSQMGADSSHA
ncbi:MAG: SRPBCC domain-containing protein [Cohaesibacteraceae bacterium]